MSNEYGPNINHLPERQVLEDGTVLQIGTDGIYRPLVDSQSYAEEDSEPQYQPRETIKQEKRNHPPKTKFTKFVIGSMVVGACTVPVAAHIITEYNTNATIDAIKPGDDEPLTPEDLIHDLGKTVDGFTLKPIRNMLGGE